MIKENCSGCYNDEYNHGLGGAKECFSLKSAKMIDRIPVHINQMPPYDKKQTIKLPNCFRRPQMCYPSPSDLTAEGYWRC